MPPFALQDELNDAPICPSPLPHTTSYSISFCIALGGAPDNGQDGKAIPIADGSAIVKTK